MKIFDKYPMLKWLMNKYVITGLSFVAWMIFLDANNYFIHSELSEQIENLENDIEYYEQTLEEERELLNQLETNPEAFERYARENFGMHKEGETITIIEFETDQDD
jgi:cell division protein FtsB